MVDGAIAYPPYNTCLVTFASKLSPNLGSVQTDDKPLPRSDKRSVIRHFYLQQQA